jgi:hypothetical protein
MDLGTHLAAERAPEPTTSHRAKTTRRPEFR